MPVVKTSQASLLILNDLPDVNISNCERQVSSGSASMHSLQYCQAIMQNRSVKRASPPLTPRCGNAGAAVAREDFAGAMSAMAKLRPAVDAFFDKVKVNDDDPKVRENRLKLLNEIRAATRAVADFSKIQE